MDSVKEHVEGSLRRPVSVTVISLLLMLFAAIGVFIIFVTAFAMASDPELGGYSLFLVDQCVAVIIIVVISVGMLKGRNWAVLMFLWLTPIYIAFAIIAQVSQGSIRPGPFINIIFYVIFVVFLTRPAAVAYFAQYSQSILIVFLWLRYLRKKKIVFLSIAAVALFVSLLIVVSSLFTGFIEAYEQSAVDTIGDIVLSVPTKFSKYPMFIEQLEQLGAVEHATATLLSQGLLHLPKGNVRAVSIWGIEPGPRARVTGFKGCLLRQKDSPGDPSFEVAEHPEKIGGFVGIGVFGEPNEKTDEYDFGAVEEMFGQRVFLTTGAMKETKTDENETSVPSVKRKLVSFLVADVVFTGVYDLDKRFVYLPIEELQKALYPDEVEPLADQVQIKLSPGTDVESALAQIRGVWRLFVDEQLNGDMYLIRYTDIETAREMQSRYVAELRKQMWVLLVIFGVVGLCVLVLIFCIFYMIVQLKQKDIAIMKSCGTASGSVALIFVGFGLFVGIIASVIGVILGYFITKNVDIIENWISVIFGLKLWKSSVYMFSKIPNEVNWDWALRIVLAAIVAAVIGTLIPAIIAALTKPVKILRYE